jgi:hypothetical protein
MKKTEGRESRDIVRLKKLFVGRHIVYNKPRLIKRRKSYSMFIFSPNLILSVHYCSCKYELEKY